MYHVAPTPYGSTMLSMATFDLFGNRILDEIQPPIEWPVPLRFRHGSPQRLRGVAVWYDFLWEEVFNHELSQFPNGQRLADLLLQDCPQDKTPVLILHRSEDVSARIKETDTHYCLIVNIQDYLANAKADPARTYFTLRLNGLTGLTDLDVKAIEQWAAVDQTRMDQLAGIAGVERISIAGIDAWAKDDPVKLQQLAEIGGEAHKPDALCKVLEWASQADNANDVLAALDRLNPSNLEQLNSLIGIAKLNEATAIWASNQENSSEEFWQESLHKHAYVLSQVFAFPIVVIKGKAFVGGKGLGNSGGNVVDYLCKTVQTSNALLTEIKTPTSPLIGTEYRDGVFNIGRELTGGVLQISNYKDSLLKECRTLLANASLGIEDAIDPPCLLIVGNTEQLTLPSHRKSFELFRRGLKDVQVITFDELFMKVDSLVKILEGKC